MKTSTIYCFPRSEEFAPFSQTCASYSQSLSEASSKYFLGSCPTCPHLADLSKANALRAFASPGLSWSSNACKVSTCTDNGEDLPKSCCLLNVRFTAEMALSHLLSPPTTFTTLPAGVLCTAGFLFTLNLFTVSFCLGVKDLVTTDLTGVTSSKECLAGAIGIECFWNADKSPGPASEADKEDLPITCLFKTSSTSLVLSPGEEAPLLQDLGRKGCQTQACEFLPATTKARPWCTTFLSEPLFGLTFFFLTCVFLLLWTSAWIGKRRCLFRWRMFPVFLCVKVFAPSASTMSLPITTVAWACLWAKAKTIRVCCVQRVKTRSPIFSSSLQLT